MSIQINLGSESSSKIRYKTQFSPLASQKAGEDRNVARVYTNKTYSLTELGALMAKHYNFMEEEDFVYTLSCMSKEMQELLIAGNAINIGDLVTLRPTIAGTFKPDQSFDADVHEIRISASCGKILRHSARNAGVEYIGTSAKPIITCIRNEKDYEENVLICGENAEIKGKRLNFNEAEDEGIFISCPEYEGSDLAVKVVKAEATEIKIEVTGSIDTTYTAFLTFCTRGKDKNASVTEIKREVTFKPAVD